MDIFNIVTEITRNPQRSVLATTVSVQGHAYRKVGATMLMLEEGLSIGCISPGCLELDLQERVSLILLADKPQLVEYDMSDKDDLSWGEVIGCGGKLQVLLEPVSGVLLEFMLEVKRKLDQNIGVHFIRLIDPDGVHVKYKLVPFAESLAETISVPGMDGSAKLFAQTYTPKPRLIIFGAGHDSIPIAELGRRSGFRIVIADWRPLLCAKERYGNAAEFVIGFPQKILQQLRLDDKDYVIVMSHHLRWDSEFLHGVAQCDVKYAGIMGSQTRCELLLKGIEAPERFHAPIGMKIGADGPEEIAISILAELIRVRSLGMRVNVLDKGDSYEAKGGWNLPSRGKKQSDGAAQIINQALERREAWI
ncbi:XdhC family protein [Paenibacillus psychroresistens]|nr:XdhC/CoxI family protein [Paenibacillus psychroresistens]